MANASWIYVDLVALGIGILCVVLFEAFVDDLRRRFYWTRGLSYWTKARLRLSSAGFHAADRCKTTISAWRAPRAIATPNVDAFRTRLVARLDRGRLALRETALSYGSGIRCWGERFLPHAAVGSVQLKKAQLRAMSALTADPASELTRGQYEQLAGVGRSQAAYDLAELVEAGLLERVGSGRATRYRLAREGGTQRHWTSDRIRAELEAFCSGRKMWPSAADFKEAGRGDLYVAASRYGGIGHWAEVLEFPRSPRGPSTAPEPVRGKLAWAGGGALAALAVAVVVGAIVVSATRHAAAPAAKTRQGVLGAQAGKQPARPARTAAKKTGPAHPRQRQHAPRSVTAGSRRGSSLLTYSSSAAPRSTPVVRTARTFSAVTQASGGPAPLVAPSGSSPPNPLKAP